MPKAGSSLRGLETHLSQKLYCLVFQYRCELCQNKRILSNNNSKQEIVQESKKKMLGYDKLLETDLVSIPSLLKTSEIIKF